MNKMFLFLATFVFVVLALLQGTASAQTTAVEDGELRWELITTGATDISDGQSSPTQSIPNLSSGTTADFLFRLNYLARDLKYCSDVDKRHDIETSKLIYKIAAEKAAAAPSDAVKKKAATDAKTVWDNAVQACAGRGEARQHSP
jgi:hypothetical protein